MCRSGRAIDFIDGRNYLFYGDPELLKQMILHRNFHLKPSRILNRISPTSATNEVFICNRVIYTIHKNKKNSVG